MAATTKLASEGNGQTNDVTLRLTESKETLLDSLLKMMRDCGPHDPTETINRLVMARGKRGSIIDLADGLALVAEREDSPAEDYEATVALLERIKAWTDYIRED